MIELTDEILAKVIKKRKKASYKGTYSNQILAYFLILIALKI